MEKKSNHQVNVIRVGEVHPHPNADKLEITFVGGYQVVIGKGQFKTGDLAVYIQPDSVVPQTEPFRFIWNDHVGIDGTVPERRRRITVRRFRKEWSEGLLMPLREILPCVAYPDTAQDAAPNYVEEGQDVSDLLSITHYDPDAGLESTSANVATAPRHRYPRTWKGWFFFLLYKLGFKKTAGKSLALEVNFHSPVYDVEALKNFKNVFQPGELVRVTEKIHGSNARYTCVDDTFYAGSHQQWKQKGDNIWWKAVELCPAIEEWCRNNPGVVLYGEVTPTQKGFHYGSEAAQLFAFDVFSEGEWNWPGYRVDFLGINVVPILYQGPYSDELLKLADGPSTVPGANYPREGCVIRPLLERRVPGLGRVHLKVVSNAFLEKDSK